MTPTNNNSRGRKQVVENLNKFQEARWEVLLIGHQIDRVFLRENPALLLPERASESDAFFETFLGTGKSGKSEQESDSEQTRSNVLQE